MNLKQTFVNTFPAEIDFRGAIVKTNFLSLICDLPAKANILHMMQYNCYFGCTVCLIPGVHRNHRHLYISSNEYELRTDESHQKDILNKTNGVTGLSVMHKLMKIPTGAPIDYMLSVCMVQLDHYTFIGRSFKCLMKII